MIESRVVAEPIDLSALIAAAGDEYAGALSIFVGRPVEFRSCESEKALLNDASRAIERFGTPTVDTETVMVWTADWIARHRRLLGKPTHFEVSDGRY